MKFTPKEVAKLVEIRSRFMLAVQQYLNTPTSFDALLSTLWQLHSATEEWFILLSPYYDQISEISLPDHCGALAMLIAGKFASKEYVNLHKELNAIMYDKYTNEAYKTLYEGSPVISLCTPVSINTSLKTGGKPIYNEGRIFTGTVKTEKTVKYQVKFSDGTELSWQPSDDMNALKKVRQQFDKKIKMLANARKTEVSTLRA